MTMREATVPRHIISSIFLFRINIILDQSLLPTVKTFSPSPLETESTPLYPPLRGGPFTSSMKAEKETLCDRLHYGCLSYGRLCYLHIAAICML